ncbi:Mitochondrial import inner membrane translocase subunit TIM14 [Hondaea fermentalgiana]|uniref:Mitochondrial import inner membrane translocase subunit TIM14 n=1 Tax=Hondaea fermentalgiana TaxID=2315210 RepID=A0A2R5G207_9STRA|nr:Mitochondrial import inner membrane translocase subunit TIM14 [Hondaea fermentalgiana]|eukprot:GBG25040.1 Mitochondrial import inner membrane translocase subunit TIM14 [Hondaea fermentalgiana]
MGAVAARQGVALGHGADHGAHTARRTLRQAAGTFLDARREEDAEQKDMRDKRFALQSRGFRATVPQESLSPLIVGGGVAVVAYSGKLVLEAIDRRQARQEAAAAAAKEEAAQGGGETEKKESGWLSWLSFMLGKNFYEGGFEEEMTKREAALILGIRESATREKVREAHRRLAMLNHPDTGGSTYVATKINEAKDKLLGAK